jgi:hypothetical protein
MSNHSRTKDVQCDVPLSGLDLGVHGSIAACHRQIMVPHVPIIRVSSPVDTWVDHILHPPLSVNISPLLGRLKHYAQVTSQRGHINTTLDVDIKIQTSWESPVIQGFVDNFQLCIRVAVCCTWSIYC